ncbi:MAG TPA: ATP synthase F1 subunit delta [Ignavibacteria bacterium]|nr:ATP synthase F1 subunit delta [Ignavibacteria bacterium]
MQSKASRRYSLALYDTAKEKGQLKEVTKDINFAIDLITSNRDLEMFFSSPVIPKQKKLDVVKNIFGGKVSDLCLDFMNLLFEKRRGDLTLEVFKDFIRLNKDREGIVDVFIKTSIELSDAEKANMKAKIDSYTKRNSILNFEIDKSIIGGFVAKIDDTILDASIKRQLEMLKNKFIKGDFVLN